ncbi:MAG: GIY-YIG nuclease family protein [Planctomycetota bacterium]
MSSPCVICFGQEHRPTNIEQSRTRQSPGVDLADQPKNAKSKQRDENQSKRTASQSAVLDQAIIDAFALTHDGWSSDEVILRDTLNQAFLKEVRTQLKASSDQAQHTDTELNWRLLTLRKAGKLTVKATKRAKSVGNTEALLPIAEMAMRSVQDKHSVSSDQVMTNPVMRDEFDSLVMQFDEKADLYRVRKAAFQLRKTRRLKPELISRIADWGREIKTYSVDELRSKPAEVPEKPGIYIFRDSTGYLYIGQASNLRERLQGHLDASHNRSLADYLDQEKSPSVEVHSFDPKSRASEVRVRRAYESELIAVRKPKFNIQP